MRYGTGVATVVIAGILWSLQGLLLRQVEVAEPWAILFWRSVGMVPVLLGFLIWRNAGAVLSPIRAVGRAGILGGLSLVFAFGGSIYAMQATTIANAVFLFAASPFLAAALGWFLLNEKVRPDTWGAIALALAGIFVMVRENLAGGALAGNVAALTSALGFALFTVTLRWRHLGDTLPVVLLGALFAILAAALAAAFDGQVLWVPWGDRGWAMAMGAFTLSGGMVLYTLGSRVVPAAELTLLSMLEVMLAPVWVWLFLGETASANTFVGGAVILAAVVLNGLLGARRVVPRGV